MLIWKTNSLDVNIASVRYRCLLPVLYLESQGYKSCIFSGKEEISFNRKSDVIIFVKSFTSYDLSLAQTANQAGIPIILDICDNLFIDEYSAKIGTKPSEIFKQMSILASAIVTTGSALKDVVENEIFTEVPVLIIPDGKETYTDIQNAIFFLHQWRNWFRLADYEPTLSYNRMVLTIKKHIKGCIDNSISSYQKNISKLINKLGNIKQYLLCKYRYNNQSISITDRSLIYNKNISLSDNYLKENQLFVNNSYQRDINHHNTILKKAATEPVLQAEKDYKKIIWFGNHGAKYGNFGILNILDIADDLINLSHEIKFSLVIVSNNYEKYRQYILPLPFPTEYINWEPLQIYKYISESDVTIIPNSKSDFSICKSANRAVLSLSLGVPVVATKTPALSPFEGCTIFDDWEQGLRAYLTDQELIDTHIKKAQSIIHQNYSGEAIANQWINVLNQVVGKGM